MHGQLKPLLQPLTLAALVTLATVAWSIHGELGAQRPLGWGLLGLFGTILLLLDRLGSRPRLRVAGYVVLVACAMAVVALAPRTGTSPILVVVLVAALAVDYPAWRVLVMAALLNLALYLVLRAGGHGAPGHAVGVFLGFQGFAALVAYYARGTELARDRLAQVNADLLATRALLSDSIRDAERMRVARELHDVAGHRLTALTLNLRALADVPALAGRAELQVARTMAAELMADLRQVVQALRHDRGLDLATALHAIAAPFPRPSLRLAMADDVCVEEAGTAEVLLRMVQEALTNAARHGQARHLHVAIRQESGRIAVTIEDDGRAQVPLREGNGLSGMRERLAEAGGTLALSVSACGGMRIDASLPA
ncbi:histidine kinase [uncultured Luteimonas sp.]|uniref:sensor histidine kinase n=1 Tax=uncultured Luteimonas sp. TaxID=453144 RepID=UPI0026209C9B|nr:histidine kinase [uncultured Luteimonas sp.]